MIKKLTDEQIEKKDAETIRYLARRFNFTLIEGEAIEAPRKDMEIGSYVVAYKYPCSVYKDCLISGYLEGYLGGYVEDGGITDNLSDSDNFDSKLLAVIEAISRVSAIPNDGVTITLMQIKEA